MFATLVYLVELFSENIYIYICMKRKISHIFIYAKKGWGTIKTFEVLPMWMKEIKLCIQELIPHRSTIRDSMLLRNQDKNNTKHE